MTADHDAATDVFTELHAHGDGASVGSDGAGVGLVTAVVGDEVTTVDVTVDGHLSESAGGSQGSQCN